MKTNTNIAPQTKTLNNLWAARKRAGFERKQVSFLLSKKSNDEISHYERGLNLPNLKTALKLEIIYQMPVRLLFHELFEQLQSEVDDLRRRRAPLISYNYWFPKSAEQLKQEEYCFYADLLKNQIPSNPELDTVIKHIIALNNTAADFRQGRKPFEDDQSDKDPEVS